MVKGRNKFRVKLIYSWFYMLIKMYFILIILFSIVNLRLQPAKPEPFSTAKAYAFEKTATPEFKPLPGIFDKPANVVLNSATQSATIFYTSDGPDPLTSTTRRQFRRSFSVSYTSVIKVVRLLL